MLGPIKFIRLLRINFILSKYCLRKSFVGHSSRLLRFVSTLNPWSLNSPLSRGESLRIALEELGPIFVKFGQLLSTRRDLLPDDIADELAKLQDQVAPFPGKKAQEIIETSLGQPVMSAFASFDLEPLASASIAQVHAAMLSDGSEVVIKVLRPEIERTIRQDIALMYFAAKLLQKFWRQGRRLRPVELVAEFEMTITDEMDMLREAGNASQLRRNFENSSMMYVPKIYWPFVGKNMLVMERIYGVRISDINSLKAANTNLKKLAEHGVEIFFTQVLRDSFFHADMHPGNLFVNVTDPQNPVYIGVDFGIMGSLSPEDQQYIAANLLAFFNRDYRQVAILHVESGWVPANTRIDQFESAIRTVCEPIFEKPLKDISFGSLLLNLFRTAERFDMQIQPQLLLLQKTLLSIEGLGRQLYPELDLWQTAQPFLEKWARKRYSLCSIGRDALDNMPSFLEKALKSPQVLYDVLVQYRGMQKLAEQQIISKNQLQKSRLKIFFFSAGITLVASTLVTVAIQVLTHTAISTWNWLGAGFAALSLLVSGLLPRER